LSGDVREDSQECSLNASNQDDREKWSERNRWGKMVVRTKLRIYEDHKPTGKKEETRVIKKKTKRKRRCADQNQESSETSALTGFCGTVRGGTNSSKIKNRGGEAHAGSTSPKRE